jgi:hypothetical protein
MAADAAVAAVTGVRNGLADLPKPADLEARADRWRPYRTIGSGDPWRVTELE